MSRWSLFKRLEINEEEEEGSCQYRSRECGKSSARAAELDSHAFRQEATQTADGSFFGGDTIAWARDEPETLKQEKIERGKRSKTQRGGEAKSYGRGSKPKPEIRKPKTET